MKQVILFVDNNDDFRDSWSKNLINAGYEVREAANAREAREVLENAGIDLAIIDVRLEDEDIDLDISGLNLACTLLFRHIPKIMITGHKPSPESIRKLRSLSAEALPSAITWVGKEEGPRKLLEIIPQVISLWPQLQNLHLLANKISDRIINDHNAIRLQAYLNYFITILFTVIGFFLIVLGIVLAMFSHLEVGIIGALSGIVTEVLGILVFQQLNRSNDRMDLYHRELLQTDGVGFLLATCGQLPASSQITTIEHIIKSATNSWFPPPQNT